MDKQSFLHHRSYHPLSTKKSIRFSQALRLLRWNRLFESAWRTQVVKKPIYTRRKLIQDVFSTACNKKLPNIRQCFDENWHLLSINPLVLKVFKDKPVIAYRRNDNLRKLIGQNKLSGDTKILFQTHKK